MVETPRMTATEVLKRSQEKSMLLTPPDIISQTLIAVPMWLLFEASKIIVVFLKNKNQLPLLLRFLPLILPTYMFRLLNRARSLQENQWEIKRLF
jgi:hypothetical protein